jgi:hypothetical protein
MILSSITVMQRKMRQYDSPQPEGGVHVVCRARASLGGNSRTSRLRGGGVALCRGIYRVARPAGRAQPGDRKSCAHARPRKPGLSAFSGAGTEGATFERLAEISGETDAVGARADAQQLARAYSEAHILFLALSALHTFGVDGGVRE